MEKRNRVLRKKITNIVWRLKTRYKPEAIILFGSLAHGKFRKDSDVDLMIIKKTKSNPWKRQEMIEKFMDHSVPIDLLVYTPSEIRKRLSLNDYFLREIIEKGKVLYERKGYSVN